MQSEDYNLELREFKSCKLHHLEGYDSGKRPARACTQSAEFEAEIWLVASEPKTKCTMLSLRSASLWTILIPFPMYIRLFIYLFIYLSVICLTMGVLRITLHFII